MILKSILQALSSATQLPVKPLFTTTIGDQIVYKHYPLSDNGAHSLQRLEIRLITKTYENAESYRKIIINTLVPVGDNVLIDGITECYVDGGGSLYEGETKTYHTILYFNYTQRSENI